MFNCLLLLHYAMMSSKSPSSNGSTSTLMGANHTCCVCVCVHVLCVCLCNDVWACNYVCVIVCRCVTVCGCVGVWVGGWVCMIFMLRVDILFLDQFLLKCRVGCCLSLCFTSGETCKSVSPGRWWWTRVAIPEEKFFHPYWADCWLLALAQ